MKRPNVLILYTDQQRLDSLACYGNDKVYTPNLDHLAAQGARLNKYFVQSPVCMPSRMSFLTGRYCSSFGIGANGVPLSEGTDTLADYLGRGGYDTAQIGKLHFLPHARRNHKDLHPSYGFDTLILSDEPGCYDDSYIQWVKSKAPDQVDLVRTSLPPEARKFDKKTRVTSNNTTDGNTHEPYVFEGDEGLTHSDFVTDETITYLKNRKGNPFFCIAGFYAPHTPLNPPKKWLDYYKDITFDPPKRGEDEGWMAILEGMDADRWQEIKRHYYALVSHVDECVGRILSCLDEEGMAEDTVVIFTSDHGEFLGDHGRIQKGRPGHDCIINVPFILRYPRMVPADRVIDALTEGVDMVPTVLDYCSFQTPPHVQGVSMQGLLSGKVQNHKDTVLMEYFQPAFNDRPALCHTTLRTDQYKYYLSGVEEGLYDLNEDPDELVNRLNQPEYEAIVSSLRKQMIRRLQEVKYCDTNFQALY